MNYKASTPPEENILLWYFIKLCQGCYKSACCFFAQARNRFNTEGNYIKLSTILEHEIICTLQTINSMIAKLKKVTTLKVVICNGGLVMLKHVVQEEWCITIQVVPKSIPRHAGIPEMNFQFKMGYSQWAQE